MPTPAFASSPSSPRLLIVGAGLAGMAAALRLAEAGLPVTVVETRGKLGGRATSFTDPTTGQALDNCQHVLLRCCTNLLDFYQRLGVADQIEWHRRLNFAFPQRDRRGKETQGIIFDSMQADDLPAPLHLSAAMLGFQGLSWKVKLEIGRGMLAAMRTPRATVHHLSFADWLHRVGQSPGVIQHFWEPISVGAVNETPDRMAADAALQVFQEAMLASEQAYIMGLAKIPLLQLYEKVTERIQAAGGQMLLGVSAEKWVFDERGRRVQALQAAGNKLFEADLFVSALPADRLAKLTGLALRDADSRLQRLEEIEYSPIIGIHLMFCVQDDRPLMQLPHVVASGMMTQWVFNKGMTCVDERKLREQDQSPGEETACQHLHVVLSAAHREANMPAEALVEEVRKDLARLFPRTAKARLVHARVVKERHATFSLQPGFNALRPAAGNCAGVANLYLAGDWCQTGWPSTMEGAVRSGYLAAEALLAGMGRPTQLLAPELPMSSLYRWISSVNQ